MFFCIFFFFFFSSRRRHTRLQGDWSSDVCSSDLLRSIWASRRRIGACPGLRRNCSVRNTFSCVMFHARLLSDAAPLPDFVVWLKIHPPPPISRPAASAASALRTLIAA